MSAHTTFRVGGPADLFVQPSTEEELSACLDLFFRGGVSVSLVGGGSNLLVADPGIRGAVICLSGFSEIAAVAGSAADDAGDVAVRDTVTADATADAGTGSAPGPAGMVPGVSAGGATDAARSGLEVLVRAGAGVSMNDLTEWCASSGLCGLERFAGLPGTVGGAVFMNARCYELSVADVFFSAEVLSFDHERYIIEERRYDPAGWDYKKSPFQERSGANPLIVGEHAHVVLSAVFGLCPGDIGRIRAEMAQYVKDREAKGHFRFPSAGSMFKNNRSFGKPSGKLIDEAGLRGFRVGDAQVAPWHGNIVINTGNARAEDLRTLVTEVQKRVLAATGCALEPEVIFAGEW